MCNIIELTSITISSYNDIRSYQRLSDIFIQCQPLTTALSSNNLEQVVHTPKARQCNAPVWGSCRLNIQIQSTNDKPVQYTLNHKTTPSYSKCPHN